MDFITRLPDIIFNIHPIHTPTVHFPIALTAVAALFLLLALWRKNAVLEAASFFNMVLAAVSTVVAGATGYRDHLVRFEGEAPMANVKIFLGITLFLLTVILVIARWRNSEIAWQPKTMLLYAVGFIASFLLATTLGFIGGGILYGF